MRKKKSQNKMSNFEQVKKMRNKGNSQFGEQFMKAVTKASLNALFAIGVRSPENIDKFIVAFTENLDKSFIDLGLLSSEPVQPQTEEKKEDEATPKLAGLPTTKDNQPAGTNPPAKSINKNLDITPRVITLLEAASITTIEQLELEMGKRSLTEIEGIQEVDQANIREALKKWNT